MKLAFQQLLENYEKQIRGIVNENKNGDNYITLSRLSIRVWLCRVFISDLEQITPKG